MSAPTGHGALWWLAKLLEGVGMVIVLVGIFWSVSLGLEDDGLSSMAAEMKGLMLGGGLFALGWALERGLGTR
jgi:hypothetical protein